MEVLADREFREGLFLRRPNRFLVQCRLGRAVVGAHLPNPGRLRELLLPGSRVLLQPHRSEGPRKTRYTAVAVLKEGVPVLLHTSLTNLAAERLVEAGLLPGLEGYTVEKREVTVGRSRFDLLLGGGRRELILEVKSCTLFGRQIAMFPDAVTERGRRHLLQLASLAEGGTRTGVLFVVHWPGAGFFLPEYHTDPRFAETLAAVRRRVDVRAVAVAWNRDMTLSPRVRELPVPWKILAREGRDRGAYVIVLRRRRGGKIKVGGLGSMDFPRGYYLYVGSAGRGLAARVSRHARKRKKAHWHIDYLRNGAELHGTFPVRTSETLECRMAESLGEITEGEVPRFGSSDCGCRSHLFSMRHDPLQDPGFNRFLLHYRIDRLAEGLRADLLEG